MQGHEQRRAAKRWWTDHEWLDGKCTICGAAEPSRPPRPQCDLHAATRVERATIENFIVWLGERGITLCIHEPTHFESNGGTYYQTTEKSEDLASDFVGID